MKAISILSLITLGWSFPSSGQTPALESCISHISPNPIAGDHPGTPTGVLNGTVALLPVDFQTARQFVPQQYPILTAAYKDLLPWWPNDKYPVILETNVDHDVRIGTTGPSFSFSRSALYFPFVDRLNDGYTSMTYSNHIFLSDNAAAIAGTLLYGYTIIVGDFDPECDGYRFSGNGNETEFGVSPTLESNQTEYIRGKFEPNDESPIPLAFWQNVTNQPQAGRSDTCDNFIRLYNTSLSDSNVAVEGTVEEKSQIRSGEARTFDKVWGLQGAWAFIERNYVSCQSLQGYSG